jgi:hypothetical protein
LASGAYTSNIHDTVHKGLKLTAYKLQLVKKLQENYLPWHYDFAFDIPSPKDEDIGYLSKVCYKDEATFHNSGKLNCHNYHIWKSQNPHVL